MSEPSTVTPFPGATLAAEPPGHRVAPSNQQAEQLLLGALLINNDAVERVSDFLAPEHFYYPVHGRIFKAILVFRDQGGRADAVTLRQYFERDGDLAQIGGAEYLAELAGGVLTVVNVVEYGRSIYESFLRRQLIEIGEDIVNDAYEDDVETRAAQQIQMAEEKLYRLADQGEYRGGFERFDTVLDRAIGVAEMALKRDTALTGITTGLIDMDRMLGGLQKSDLVILAARPAMGKSALAANVAFNAAKSYLHSQGKEGAVAGFFSLEMSAEQLATRLLADQAEIPSEKIRKGELNKTTDFTRLVEASNLLRQVPIFFDDTAGLTLSQLKTRAMRLKRQHNLGLIVVDYLQLMRPTASSRADNRVQEISEISRGLKLVAKELEVPVLALSQLSRAVEQREDKRPQLADLRESGSIEQDADVVMFIYREAYYLGKAEPKMDTPEHADWQAQMDRIMNVAQVIIAKQRHGPTGTIDLHFEGAFTRFGNLDTRYDDMEL